jgi:tRNA(fMet)-specific endonuclease VapC
MMFILDTDTLSHLMYGRQQVVERVGKATRDVCSTVISRIEILRGRMQAVLAAEDGNKLLQAYERLQRTEAFLEGIRLLPLDASSASEFDRLRQIKKLRKIGRGDLLIAAITLANHATLVTRNETDFSQVPGLQKPENWVD